MLVGCTKDFVLHPSGAKPKFVIEGRVSTLRPPYLVRVTLSTSDITFSERGSTLSDSAIGVPDAQVTITDDHGLIDTLQPCTQANTGSYVYFTGPSGLDSMFTPFAPFIYTQARGYYSTSNFVGVSGYTYTLHVQAGGQVFEASAYMPPVTPLDSAALKEAVIAPDGTTGLTPFAYFEEPKPDMNYYLLQSFEPGDYQNDVAEAHSPNQYTFSYYVFDDATLPAYVDGLMARVRFAGNRPNTNFFGYNLYPATTWQVRLCSLTRDAYRYLDQLGKQFENDGNTYQPAPATPEGNISNGALGLFYATDISNKLILPR